MTGIAYALVLLHMVDGGLIAINPAQIISLQPTTEAAKGTPNTLIVKGVRCVVWLSSGKYYAVTEECPTIQKMIETTP